MRESSKKKNKKKIQNKTRKSVWKNNLHWFLKFVVSFVVFACFSSWFLLVAPFLEVICYLSVSLVKGIKGKMFKK